MSNKDKLYDLLVNQVPGIKERYVNKHNKAHGKLQKAGVWIYLLKLNFLYYVFRCRSLEMTEKYPYYEEKKLYEQGSESSLSRKKAPEELVKELGQYDIISFDAFDTLIFRPFSEPTDLFFFLGHAINYPDFKRIRMWAEQKSRKQKYAKEHHYEVTLEEIYMTLEQEAGIIKEKAMQMEFDLECQFCFANPYMIEVVDKLHKMGKHLIITSDMYLDGEKIKTLLNKNGYPEFEAYYVSCDYRKSKHNGDLYEHIKREEGQNYTYAHVGDNQISDIKRAEKHGFKSFYYANVNEVGNKYRPMDMSVITGGIYRGLVNAHIHNGFHCYSREYEYGYIYGGLFVTGYCQFIHKYVKEHGIDKILFLARDGDVLSKAYHILYPEEDKNWEYVYWSRLAAVKMSARYYKYDYFRRFLYHKVNQDYTLKQILGSMELLDMLEDLCKTLGLDAEMKLTDRNVEKVKGYLMKFWNEVLAHYTEQLEVGKQYYSKILKNCKKVVAVDIGWAGSGAIALDYIVNQIWEMKCNITGIVAGTNSCQNSEPDTSETYLQSGKLVSYLYSQRENRDIWKFHSPGKGHNLYWEMLLDAPMGSLQGFYLDGHGDFECKFKEPTVDSEKIEEIQRGILTFVKQYGEFQKSLGVLGTIGGRDAYAPMLNIEGKKNKKIMQQLSGLVDDMNI